MLISIIVPIYNVEPYLKECLDSIIRQTYTKWELLLVDDGSSDNSASICMEYVEKDSRINLIQSKHRGAAFARKLGVEKAMGKYCIFVDSDDWISCDLLDTIVPYLEPNIDIVNYNMISIKDNIEKKWSYEFAEGSYEGEKLETIYRTMMFDYGKSKPGMIQALYTKMVKRELLLKAMSKVDERITWGDDASVVYTMSLLAKKIVIVNKYLYFYRVRPNSQCTSIDIDVFEKIFYFKECMERIFSEFNKEYGLEIQLKGYLIHFLTTGIRNNFQIDISPKYTLPFERAQLKGRLVLYGAGAVGRSYYRQLVENEDIEMVAWCDKNLVGEVIYSLKIMAVSDISHMNFDKLLIAVKDGDMTSEIKEQLIQWIPMDKVIWKAPIESWWEMEVNIK